MGGPFLDLDITFRQGDSEVVGMLLHSWQSGGEGGTALLYTWETSTLQVGCQGRPPVHVRLCMAATAGRLPALWVRCLIYTAGIQHQA